MAVASLAVLTGTSHAVEPAESLDALSRMVALTDVSRSSAKFDPDDLLPLNARLVHALPPEAVESRLKGMGIGDGETFRAAFWMAVRENCQRVTDAATWWRAIAAPERVEPSQDDADYLAQAAKLLPEEPFDETTWGAWTSLLKAETGRKGRALFLPLRRALTGLDHGPDMKKLLPLIGRRSSADRLS
jgi:glutamyl-tRNA synthetase